MVCFGHAKDLQTNFRLPRLGRALEAHDLHFGSEVNGVEVAGKLNIDGVDIAILVVPDIRLIPIRSNEAESIGGRNLFNDATLGSLLPVFIGGGNAALRLEIFDCLCSEVIRTLPRSVQFAGYCDVVIGERCQGVAVRCGVVGNGRLADFRY